MKKEAAKAMEYLAQLQANEQYQTNAESGDSADASLLTASVGGSILNSSLSGAAGPV
jgi:hypothetical protein